jgi:hypothetical protein
MTAGGRTARGYDAGSSCSVAVDCGLGVSVAFRRLPSPWSS